MIIIPLSKAIMKPFEPSKELDLEDGEVRKGPWTLEEDNLLNHFIARHGEGRWNLLAKSAGLKRTGKSCRLRWLNYLKPDIKRGNLTPQEQLIILELHSKWGNRWSKIAQHLPGRTDNEIKNYWRTRVQKQARQLNMESNSESFMKAIRCFYMPRLIQKIEQNSCQSAPMDYEDSRASSLPFDSTITSEMKVGDHIVHHAFIDCSNTCATSNPLEIPHHQTTYPMTWQNASHMADTHHLDNNSMYDMEELASIPYPGELPATNHQGWIDVDMANDAWNLDGLW